MNDPWDVKSVRQTGQYISCLKLNGVPLLPPVLSKECRTEMQYYKVLAKEVEKRITLLQRFVPDIGDGSDTQSEDQTDAPELPESEQNYELPQEDVQAGFAVNINKITAIPMSQTLNHSISENHKDVTSKAYPDGDSAGTADHELVLDLSLTINDTGRNVLDTITRRSPSPEYVPERDYNCTRQITHKYITEKKVITEVETVRNSNRNGVFEEIANFSFSVNKHSLSDAFPDTLTHDGPSSLSSKSFTGSLNDLHSESVRDSHRTPKLIRQRSYTLLQPSPQLLAHLEVQSQSTGVDMASISMSDSRNSISSNKKRRSWDLESAKVKWSSMALELKGNTLVNSTNKSVANKNIVKPVPNKFSHITPPKAKYTSPDKNKRYTPKPVPKSEPLNKSNTVPKCESMPKSESLPKTEPAIKTKNFVSPLKDPANRAVGKDPERSPKTKSPPRSPKARSTPAPTSESEDPATRVRELYEKIQNQQLVQMANLVEKQKREQLLLQQVFEEQNNLLFKQLKTICPKSPIEAKEAWGTDHTATDRGPVSLSQLINYKSTEQDVFDNPVSTTLTNTNNCINHCNTLLKKSRDITGSIKKQPPMKSHNQNNSNSPSMRSPSVIMRNRSPASRNTVTPRRLNYDTSLSTDRECDPILTNRTNDTMADLNVTFPSDNSEDGSYAPTPQPLSMISYFCENETRVVDGNSVHDSSKIHNSSTESAVRGSARSVQRPVMNANGRVSRAPHKHSTPEQRAAATKIVAHVKGYLVRRLMRTDRVQATVQTIKDALLCALQLHQDREGIRGADVDLHRRLIQQITAACYALHDTFVASTPAERCAMIAADRGRRRSLAARQANNSFRQTDV